MIKRLPLVLSFCSLPAFAAPQLTTEIQSGDMWFKAETTQLDSKTKYTDSSSGANITYNSSADSTNFFGLFAHDTVNGITPLFGFNVQKVSGDDSNTITVYGVDLGVINKSSNQKNRAFVLSHLRGDNEDEIRSITQLSTAFQTSDISSKNYNEFVIAYTKLADTDDIEGGSGFSISNSLKIKSDDTIDFIANVSVSIIDDTEFLNTNTTLESDATIGFEAVVALNLAPEYTMSFSLGKSFGGGSFNNGVDAPVDVDDEVTIIGVDLVARF